MTTELKESNKIRRFTINEKKLMEIEAQVNIMRDDESFNDISMLMQDCILEINRVIHK